MLVNINGFDHKIATVIPILVCYMMGNSRLSPQINLWNQMDKCGRRIEVNRNLNNVIDMAATYFSSKGISIYAVTESLPNENQIILIDWYYRDKLLGIGLAKH